MPSLSRFIGLFSVIHFVDQKLSQELIVQKETQHEKEENIAKDSKVIPDPIDDRKFQE